MTNAISIHNFNQSKVRTKIFDGKIYFCGKDVCEAIAIKNSKDALQRLTKGVVIADLPTAGGIQQAKFINEPNLYKIVLQSRKPQAEPFVNWVCNEVLPSIRKTGAYAAAPKADSWEVSDADLIRVLHNWHATKNKKETEEFRRLHAEIDMLRQKLSEVKKIVQ
ncbi:MAG: hypothetical protein IJ479_05785 [Alphaproteobacteria bacterium]|nr:hypothetical protein [Alphaproteobacteria bacterium]